MPDPEELNTTITNLEKQRIEIKRKWDRAKVWHLVLPLLFIIFLMLVPVDPTFRIIGSVGACLLS